jgi:hypothetical protein
MAKVLILVEGQTEETFIRDVLAPHLRKQNVHLITKLVVTKRVKFGGQFKGGISSYDKVEGDIRRLLNDSSADLVTTMLDYYGLPDDFPGVCSRPPGDCYHRVAHIEEEFRKDIDHLRFEPYLSLHEFEALVFVDPKRWGFVFADREKAQALQAVRDGFAGPEEIDEGPETAPSKRIRAIFPAYQKTLHGPLATKELGLQAIRDACPHFNQWVTRLESL